MTNRTIERVNAHAEAVDKFCLENGYVRVMTALYGSQNYNTNHVGSDVDTKSIVIPTFKTLVMRDKHLTTTLELDNGEHAEIKDMYEMFVQYRKQNINFIETLYTNYVNVAPQFESFYRKLMFLRDDIAHYNPRVMVLAVCGEMISKYARYFETNYTEYSPKQLSNMIRMKRYIDKYLNGNDVADCLVIPEGEEAEYHRNLKRGNIDYNQACALAMELRDWALEKREWCNLNLDHLPNQQTDSKLRMLHYGTYSEFYQLWNGV